MGYSSEGKTTSSLNTSPGLTSASNIVRLCAAGSLLTCSACVCFVVGSEQGTPVCECCVTCKGSLGSGSGL